MSPRNTSNTDYRLQWTKILRNSSGGAGILRKPQTCRSGAATSAVTAPVRSKHPEFEMCTNEQLLWGFAGLPGETVAAPSAQQLLN